MSVMELYLKNKFGKLNLYETSLVCSSCFKFYKMLDKLIQKIINFAIGQAQNIYTEQINMSHVDRMKSGQSSSTIVVSQVFPTLNQKQNEHIIMLVNERVQQQEQEKLRKRKRELKVETQSNTLMVPVSKRNSG